MTTTEIATRYVIGDTVYAKWRYPDKDDHWYEAYFVEKITDKKVWVRGFMEPSRIILSRPSFERDGRAVSISHRAVFYTAMPEEYRRQTLGYWLDEGPRKVLGLGETFTARELKDAYRKRATETHPDKGGNPNEFMAVQTAYERLSKTDGSLSLGELLRKAQEFASEQGQQ